MSRLLLSNEGCRPHILSCIFDKEHCCLTERNFRPTPLSANDWVPSSCPPVALHRPPHSDGSFLVLAKFLAGFIWSVEDTTQPPPENHCTDCVSGHVLWPWRRPKQWHINYHRQLYKDASPPFPNHHFPAPWYHCRFVGKSPPFPLPSSPCN